MAPTKTTAKPRTSAAKATKAKAKPATKTPAKAAAKKTTAKKTAAKAAPTKEAAAPAKPREFDVFGFTIGGDSSIIAHTLIEGVQDGGRDAMNDLVRKRIEAANGLKTRNGSEKYIPSLVSGILLKLRKQGFVEESSYKVTPPAELAKAVQAAKRKNAKATTSAPAKKAAPAAKKTAAKTTPKKAATPAKPKARKRSTTSK